MLNSLGSHWKTVLRFIIAEIHTEEWSYVPNRHETMWPFFQIMAGKKTVLHIDSICKDYVVVCNEE